MNLAFVGEFHDGARVISAMACVEGIEAATFLKAGTAHPVDDTLCELVANGAIPTLVRDASAEPALAGHAGCAYFGFQAYAGVPLELNDGIQGTVCVASSIAQPSLNERDAATLRLSLTTSPAYVVKQSSRR